MRYLIDTNILVFALTDKLYIDENVTAILNNSENIIFISSSSIFEVLHLYQTGRIATKFKTIKDFLKEIEVDFNPQILHTYKNLDFIFNKK